MRYVSCLITQIELRVPQIVDVVLMPEFFLV